MEEVKVIHVQEERIPDGGFDMKCGQTTYKVKVFFNHDSQMTAEDKLKRVIQEEARKMSG